MAFCIDAYSSALCLAHGTDQGLHSFPSFYFELTEHSNDTYSVMNKLSEIFESEFYSILNKMEAEDLTNSFDSFMKTTLSRFIKMSTTRNYFYFMLLNAFVEMAAFFIFNNTQCYTFVKVISLCLKAVYDRCYKDFFEANGEYESLGCYCKQINPFLLSEDGDNQFSVYFHWQTRLLLESLLDVDYENFKLTDSEVTLLNDVLNFVTIKEIPTEPEVSKRFPCESLSAPADPNCIKEMYRLADPSCTEKMYRSADSSCTEKMHRLAETSCTNKIFRSADPSCIEEMNRSANTSCIEKIEYSSHASQICRCCGGKCFKLLSSYIGKTNLL